MWLFRRKSKIEKFYEKNREFLLYTLVSLMCTIILYLLYFIINLLTNDNYLVANLIAYIVSFTVLYLWDQKLFNSRPHKRIKRIRQLFIFIVFRVIGFIIDSFILMMFIENLKMSPMESKILSSLITFMFNYITNKLFVFKKNKLL